jgi:hypothetical protein
MKLLLLIALAAVAIAEVQETSFNQRKGDQVQDTSFKRLKGRELVADVDLASMSMMSMAGLAEIESEDQPGSKSGKGGQQCKDGPGAALPKGATLQNITTSVCLIKKNDFDSKKFLGISCPNFLFNFAATLVGISDPWFTDDYKACAKLNQCVWLLGKSVEPATLFDNANFGHSVDPVCDWAKDYLGCGDQAAIIKQFQETCIGAGLTASPA